MLNRTSQQCSGAVPELLHEAGECIAFHNFEFVVLFYVFPSFGQILFLLGVFPPVRWLFQLPRSFPVFFRHFLSSAMLLHWFGFGCVVRRSATTSITRGSFVHLRRETFHGWLRPRPGIGSTPVWNQGRKRGRVEGSRGENRTSRTK